MENTPTPAAADRPALATPAPDPFAALEGHIEAVMPAHQAAWRGPVVDIYPTGAVVWMWDHYNTAVVTGPGRLPGTWAISTTDADGEVDDYEYPSGQLRPATAPVEFRSVS